MKKNLCSILVIVLCISSSSYSQVVQKGDKLFGGSFSASVFNINDSGPSYYQSSNAGIFPSFAWTIKNNLVLGVKGSISYVRSVNKFDPNDKITNNSISVGPGAFLKKYKTLKNQFGIYFSHELNGYYQLSRQSESWGGDFRFNPGVFYKFSDNFIGEANIGGVYASYFGTAGTDNIGVGVSFLQYFNIGFNYIIGKKRNS